MTGNDPGASVPPLIEYRAITACFEALPGRIIPVDLAPVMISSMIVNQVGDTANTPCDLPGIPELFNVVSSDDLGPICMNYPCQLVVRGRNFFNAASPVAPVVWLSLPDEQDGGPHVKAKLPTVIVDSYIEKANRANPYQEVSEHSWVAVNICLVLIWCSPLLFDLPCTDAM
jgi:hypothetical protein